MAVRSTSRTSTGPNPRTIALYVGLAVLAAALLFAAFGLDSDTGPTLEEVAGDPSIEGEPLPTLPAEGEDPALGSPTPVVSGADFDGNPTAVGGRDAELIVFLASWCPACQAELPELVEWLDDGGLPSGVELTAVSTGLDPNRPPWPPQGWLERGGYTGDVLVDDAEGSVASAFGMSGTPFWVVVEDGRVVARAAGQLGMDQVDRIAQSVAP